MTFQSFDLTEEQDEAKDVEIAGRIVEEVIRYANLRDVSERLIADTSLITESYIQRLNGDIYLVIFSNPGPVAYSFQTSLIEATCNIL